MNRSGSRGSRRRTWPAFDGIAATQQAYLDIGDSLESRLSELKMPTLVVHGDADSRIPVECGRSLASGIADAELHVIAGAEHGLMTNEAAGETQRIILDFLGRTAAADREQDGEGPVNDYEWDERKRQENADKHKVDFTAIYAFEWDTAVYNSNDAHGEERWVATGYIGDRLPPCRLYLAG